MAASSLTNARTSGSSPPARRPRRVRGRCPERPRPRRCRSRSWEPSSSVSGWAQFRHGAPAGAARFPPGWSQRSWPRSCLPSGGAARSIADREARTRSPAAPESGRLRLRREPAQPGNDDGIVSALLSPRTRILAPRARFPLAVSATGSRARRGLAACACCGGLSVPGPAGSRRPLRRLWRGIVGRGRRSSW